jgi:hypothetical protein
MTLLEQPVVLLPARATTFTVLCTRCIDDHPDEFLQATVTGTLRLEAAHGSAFCPRGHELRVERSLEHSSRHPASV